MDKKGLYLESCPLCGSDRVETRHDNSVHCNECGCNTGKCASVTIAVGHWNKRTIMTIEKKTDE